MNQGVNTCLGRKYIGYTIVGQQPYCFKNDIPPEAITHIENLQFIPAKKNLKKHEIQNKL